MAMMLKSSVPVRVPRAASRRSAVVVRANANRPMWYPGATAPKHLNGSMMGDYGFDPLRLGVNADNLKWFREAELTNGRWAMMAVAGILFTDLVGLPKWFLAGAEQYAVDTQTQLIVGGITFAILEGFRYSNYKRTGTGGLGPITPFDPLNMRSEQMALKELKNGRLAMLAFVGFASGAAVYGKGPIELLKLHLDNPGYNNVYTSSVGPECAVTVAVLSIWPILVEASKTLDKDQKTPVVFPWAEPWKN